MSIYSIYSGKFHDQIDRAAMESPLVPIMDNFCKEHCVQLHRNPPTGTGMSISSVVWSRGMEELSNFQGCLNSIHPNIRFTMERCYHSLLY
jgi:hypothetical protein